MQEIILEMKEMTDNESVTRVCIDKLDPELQKMLLDTYGDMEHYIAEISSRELERELLEFISGRPYRFQKVLCLRSGILDGKARTWEEVAEIMGTTRERIRMLESGAFPICSLPRRTKRLADLLEKE